MDLELSTGWTGQCVGWLDCTCKAMNNNVHGVLIMAFSTYHRASHATKPCFFALAAAKVGARRMLPATCQILRQTCTMCLGEDQKPTSWCMISSLQSVCWWGSEHVQDMPYADHLDMEHADGLPTSSNRLPVSVSMTNVSRTSVSRTWVRCTTRSTCWQKTLRRTCDAVVVAPTCIGATTPAKHNTEKGVLQMAALISEMEAYSAASGLRPTGSPRQFLAAARASTAQSLAHAARP